MLKALPEVKAMPCVGKNVNEEKSIQEKQMAQKTPKPLRPIASMAGLGVFEPYTRTSGEHGGEVSAMHDRSGLQTKGKNKRTEDDGDERGEEVCEEAKSDIVLSSVG